MCVEFALRCQFFKHKCAPFQNKGCVVSLDSLSSIFFSALSQIEIVRPVRELFPNAQGKHELTPTHPMLLFCYTYTSRDGEELELCSSFHFVLRDGQNFSFLRNCCCRRDFIKSGDSQLEDKYTRWTLMALLQWIAITNQTLLAFSRLVDTLNVKQVIYREKSRGHH